MGRGWGKGAGLVCSGRDQRDQTATRTTRQFGGENVNVKLNKTKHEKLHTNRHLYVYTCIVVYIFRMAKNALIIYRQSDSSLKALRAESHAACHQHTACRGRGGGRRNRWKRRKKIRKMKKTKRRKKKWTKRRRKRKRVGRRRRSPDTDATEEAAGESGGFSEGKKKKERTKSCMFPVRRSCWSSNMQPKSRDTSHTLAGTIVTFAPLSSTLL